MTMAPMFPAGSWCRQGPKKNGWILLDVLLALSLSALTLTVLLPLAGQTARLDWRCQIEEGLHFTVTADEQGRTVLHFVQYVN